MNTIPVKKLRIPKMGFEGKLNFSQLLYSFCSDFNWRTRAAKSMATHLTQIRNKILITINNRMDEIEEQRVCFEGDLLKVAEFVENRGASDPTIDWNGTFESELGDEFH